MGGSSPLFVIIHIEAMSIGIVTVLYNSENVLDDFFQTLDNQSYRDFVLYVIDNHSPDNSLERARKLAEMVHFRTEIIAEPENWGVAKGNNIGITRAMEDGCEYILLSNNDVVLSPDTLEKIYFGAIESAADLAVPKIYYYGTDLIWQAGGHFVYYNGATAHNGVRQKDRGQYDKPKQVSYASTCFMLIRRDVFEELGLMDERYFVYYDDTDFLWRAKKAHKKTMYLPFSKLWHKESVSTGGQMSDFNVYYMARNGVYFSKKNHGLLQRLVVVAYGMLHDLLRKPFRLNRRQRELVRKGRRDGLALFKESQQGR